MSDKPFAWLWADETEIAEPVIKVPEGGNFQTGFAGYWTIAPMWKFWVEETVDLDEMGIEPDHKQKLNNGTNIYWRPENHDAATAAGKALGLKFGPRAILRWEMQTTSMLNFGGSDVQETFGDTIAFDVNMTSLFGDTRHEYQMLFLPSLVQEMAITSGLLAERIYEYDGLTTDADLVNEDYQTRMIGGKEFEGSELWQIRVKIWQALGENDAKKYTVNQKGKTDTDSKLLGGCISLTIRRQTPLWARVTRVANPKLPKEGKQSYGVYTVNRIWPTREAAVAELGEKASDENVAEYPDLPDGWEGASAVDWIEWIKTQFAKDLSKPRPALEAAIKKQNGKLISDFACSAEDVIRWLDYLN